MGHSNWTIYKAYNIFYFFKFPHIYKPDAAQHTFLFSLKPSVILMKEGRKEGPTLIRMAKYNFWHMNYNNASMAKVNK